MSLEAQAKLADSLVKDGVLEVEQPELNADIRIRSEDLTLFETESGELLVSSPDQDGFLKPVPDVPTPSMELVTDVTTQELTELNPAEPAEQEDVDSPISTQVRTRGD